MVVMKACTFVSRFAIKVTSPYKCRVKQIDYSQLNHTIMNELENEKTVTYHRQPTKIEIKFGEGAIHYMDVPERICRKKNGELKKWVNIDMNRYYY